MTHKLTTCQRFVRFWGTLLVFNFLKDKPKIQTNENFDEIQKIYVKILKAAFFDHGLIEALDMKEYWEL